MSYGETPYFNLSHLASEQRSFTPLSTGGIGEAPCTSLLVTLPQEKKSS